MNWKSAKNAPHLRLTFERPHPHTLRSGLGCLTSPPCLLFLDPSLPINNACIAMRTVLAVAVSMSPRGMWLSKGQNPLHLFSLASPEQVGASPQEVRNKLATSRNKFFQNPLHQFPHNFLVVSPQQIYNKLVWAKVHGVWCVVSFPKNNLLPTCCGLVSDILTCQDNLPCH